MFTFHIDDEVGHLMNPSLSLSDEEETDDEGCLYSPRPGLSRQKRAHGVVAEKGFDMHGEPVTLEGTGRLARCVQHETDHLDGVLFINQLNAAPANSAMKEMQVGLRMR